MSSNVWTSNTNLAVLFEELCCRGEVGNSVFTVWTPWERRTHRWDIITAHHNTFTPQRQASCPKQHLVQEVKSHKHDATNMHTFTATNKMIPYIIDSISNMFIKHVSPSQSCSYLEVYTTLEMVHLYVMRDRKSLYYCHKHKLPGSLCSSSHPYTVSQYFTQIHR